MLLIARLSQKCKLYFWTSSLPPTYPLFSETFIPQLPMDSWKQYRDLLNYNLVGARLYSQNDPS